MTNPLYYVEAEKHLANTNYQITNITIVAKKNLAKMVIFDIRYMLFRRIKSDALSTLSTCLLLTLLLELLLLLALDLL